MNARIQCFRTVTRPIKGYQFLDFRVDGTENSSSSGDAYIAHFA
ncbi:hypothetical protein GCM10025794_37100 [Massilia kyonggiensis]